MKTILLISLVLLLAACGGGDPAGQCDGCNRNVTPSQIPTVPYPPITTQPVNCSASGVCT